MGVVVESLVLRLHRCGADWQFFISGSGMKLVQDSALVFLKILTLGHMEELTDLRGLWSWRRSGTALNSDDCI
jgi:hypothetical protein